ncbi:MAG: Cytochrome c, class I [uncultured Sulfurovum sp.]|uniref:Cytochrome c, class I n=1 Tax=uncultured Sulfurovum sp. TaxID=269237 RepID=A0A6S6SEX1_9BACT|nr:MAG: Cytochrome c, class I [uncultured Sulfurovum sp.]
MKLLTLFTLLLTTTLYSNSSMQQLYLKNACNACHGMYGEGIGASPRLQGVRKEILLRRLVDLQKGKTRSAFGSIMISFAKALDENQTIAMAQYLSELQPPENVERYEIEYEPSGDGGS